MANKDCWHPWVNRAEQAQLCSLYSIMRQPADVVPHKLQATYQKAATCLWRNADVQQLPLKR
jgi:hypothetical protein